MHCNAGFESENTAHFVGLSESMNSSARRRAVSSAAVEVVTCDVLNRSVIPRVGITTAPPELDDVVDPSV